MDGVPFDPTRPIGPPVPTHNGNQKRAVTSMDDMEREFMRKKERELQAARLAGGGDGGGGVQQRRVGDKVGRNDPCPCGSGKKYKKCCGA